MSRNFRAVVGEAYERCCQLAHPKGGQDSPVKAGAPIGTWISSAGINVPVGADVVRLEWRQAMSTGLQDATVVVQAALQRMAREGLVEARRDRGTAVWRPVPGKGIHQ